jgi:hypothetical protein
MVNDNARHKSMIISIVKWRNNNNGNDVRHYLISIYLSVSFSIVYESSVHKQSIITDHYRKVKYNDRLFNDETTV